MKNLMFAVKTQDYHSPIAVGVYTLGATSAKLVRFQYNVRVNGVIENTFVVMDLDLSNLVNGITYRHGSIGRFNFVDSVFTADGSNVELCLIARNENNPLVIENLGEKMKFVNVAYPTQEGEIKGRPTQTVIFPPPETDAEWKDRMLRTVAHCAHNLEKALGELTPQIYTHSLDFATAHLTSNMLDAITTTGVHARLPIGYLWHQVSAALGNAPTKPTKADVEANVLAMYENMKSPEHIKMFFHNHDEETWKKLRFSSADNRHNHRRIHLWQSDATPGKLLLDVNEKHTTNGELHELNARAEFHTCMTQDYKLAASSPNWELVKERTY